MDSPTAQLNQAARHRNVYYDTIGGDPYGERGFIQVKLALTMFITFN